VTAPQTLHKKDDHWIFHSENDVFQQQHQQCALVFFPPPGVNSPHLWGFPVTVVWIQCFNNRGPPGAAKATSGSIIRCFLGSDLHRCGVFCVKQFGTTPSYRPQFVGVDDSPLDSVISGEVLRGSSRISRRGEIIRTEIRRDCEAHPHGLQGGPRHRDAVRFSVPSTPNPKKFHHAM